MVNHWNYYGGKSKKSKKRSLTENGQRTKQLIDFQTQNRLGQRVEIKLPPQSKRENFSKKATVSLLSW